MCGTSTLRIHKGRNQTAAWRKRVIHSNWDIFAALEKDRVNATLEQLCLGFFLGFFDGDSHKLYSGAHLRPVPKEKSPGRKVRHCKHYYASRQQISCLIAAQLY